MPAYHRAEHLVVLRHGQTRWSRTGRHTGRTDLPLEPEGEDQARVAGKVLAAVPFAQVLVSPLRRARRTCELAGLGPQASIRNDLAEWDYGAYEGLTTAGIRRQRPGWTIWSEPPPDGETADQVGARADRIIAEARQAEGDVLAVAHAHVLRILAARWLGLPAAAGALFVLEPGAFGVLGWERDTPAILRWNISRGSLLG